MFVKTVVVKKVSQKSIDDLAESCPCLKENPDNDFVVSTDTLDRALKVAFEKINYGLKKGQRISNRPFVVKEFFNENDLNCYSETETDWTFTVLVEDGDD